VPRHEFHFVCPPGIPISRAVTSCALAPSATMPVFETLSSTRLTSLPCPPGNAPNHTATYPLLPAVPPPVTSFPLSEQWRRSQLVPLYPRHASPDPNDSPALRCPHPTLPPHVLLCSIASPFPPPASARILHTCPNCHVLFTIPIGSILLPPHHRRSQPPYTLTPPLLR